MTFTAMPKWEDFMTADQTVEFEDYQSALESWFEACECFSESDAEYRNEVIQFGDASFQKPEFKYVEPTPPAWWAEVKAKHEAALSEWYKGADAEVQAQIDEDNCPF